MSITGRYRTVADMPRELPMFPLRGAILLPRASLTLNVFEPRYLALVDHALAGDRLIGVVQPAAEPGGSESPQGRTFPLRSVGCAGRLFSFTESDDGRVVIALAGVARFTIAGDIAGDTPFRICQVDFAPYASDFIAGQGEEEVDRPQLLTALKNYLLANNLNADWDRINSAGSERLVNTLSILSPYGAEEKQALLEAPDLKSRAEALVALAEMELATRDDGSGTSIQ
ncbi:MAG TPA: LON peptidase substrate-binding domain-containing protein [Methyloceanibacter sp.]|nr:LON peptidase substrate-binding domain-containing protein [Methyloceanibacter sp.]